MIIDKHNLFGSPAQGFKAERSGTRIEVEHPAADDVTAKDAEKGFSGPVRGRSNIQCTTRGRE